MIKTVKIQKWTRALQSLKTKKTAGVYLHFAISCLQITKYIRLILLGYLSLQAAIDSWLHAAQGLLILKVKEKREVRIEVREGNQGEAALGR